MNNIDILIKAIREKHPVKFEYIKLDKINGERIGNPYAIYKDPDTQNINIHLYQTAGVSDSELKPTPWRTFIIEHMQNIEIVENQVFEVAEGYNPLYSKYSDCIEKI